MPSALIPVYAYAVRNSSGVLLFDTGVGPPHDAIDSLYRPRRASLPDLLAKDGMAIADVAVVVNCHLHFDHCGGNPLFPHARVVVQRTELEEARRPMYTIREWVDFDGAQFDIVDGEHPLSDEMRVVPTPGHTRGHQSLLVETSEGLVILAGQAADSASDFEAGTSSWGADLATAGAESVLYLKAFSPHRVLFAHDAEAWTASAGLS